MKKFFMAKMSSGKRLAKRSIVGMRVCALCDDGFYYPCRIVGVKTPCSPFDNQNCINLGPNTRFTVRFDPNAALPRRCRCEFPVEELIGDGFTSILDARLQPEQRVFITYNGREISGTVIEHDIMREEVTILVQVSASETPFELVKKLEEVRLAESRRSPRLADQANDTDFARLADMGGDRRRSSSYSIDTPPSGSGRKRRISYSQEDLFEPESLGDMSECNAALVLMSLSHSPNASIQGFSSGSVQSYSGSSSPPLSDDGNVSSSSTSSDQKMAGKSQNIVVQHLQIVHNMRRGQRTTSLSTSDEGIVMDYVAEEMPRVVKRRGKIFKCTWKNCGLTFGTDQQVKSHVRNAHLGPKSNDDEDFYYTDLEDEDEAIVLEASNTSPPLPPTLSHSDMARPPHEDPEYQRKIVGNMRQGLLMSTNNGQTFVKVPMSSPMVLPNNSNYTWSPLPSQNSPHKASRPSNVFPHAPYISPTYSTANYPVLVQQYHSMPSQKLSHSSPPQLPPPPQQNALHSSPKTATGGSGPGKIRPNITSPRRTRGENKKCRKVYGMDNREMWCTQCKWKKACSRFGE